MKTMKNIIYALSIGAALSLTACLDRTDDTGFTPLTPEISFEELTLDVDNTGGEKEITLNSNLPWRMKANVSWITFPTPSGQSGGTVKIIIAKNRLRDELKGTVTAYITDEHTATLTVTQAAASSSEAITYYVKTDGDPLSDGISWEDATTLPTAIDAAGDGDLICLAAGTYLPVSLLPGGESEEEKTFEIHSNFTLEGGYPANAATGATSDPSQHLTVLSGNLGSTSAYHVVTVTAAKSAEHRAALKNLTISDGVGYGTNDQVKRIVGGAMIDIALGGGMFVGISNLDVVNCRISDNEACLSGGVHIYVGADVRFEDCTISGNSATSNGGGIWNQGATVFMNNCTVSGNTSGQQAAGYYSIDSGGAKSVSRIYNSTFSDNDNTRYASGRSGGGAYIRAGSDAVFVNCTFTGNKAGYGGAIMGHGASAALQSHTLCISCTFTANSAASGGGALFCYNNNAEIVARNCIVSGNTGPTASVDAGVLTDVSADRIKTYASIVGAGLFDSTGASVGSWTFTASSMLGTLGYNSGGTTRSYPLVVSAENPAVGQGLDAAGLKALSQAVDPAIDQELLAADQNGTARGGKSIGSVTAE